MLTFASIPISRRWMHIFECSRHTYTVKDTFTQFCFICSMWIAGKDLWEIHCQSHISKEEIPIRCDLLRFRHGIAFPGYCITCLHNTGLPASQRVSGFMKEISWRKHIQKCFDKFAYDLAGAESIACPHPHCFSSYASVRETWYHLQDAHSYPTKEAEQKPSLKRHLFITDRHAPRAKRRKVKWGQDSVKMDPVSEGSDCALSSCESDSILLNHESTDGFAKSSSSEEMSSTPTSPTNPPSQSDSQLLCSVTTTSSTACSSQSTVHETLSEMIDPQLWSSHPTEDTQCPEQCILTCDEDLTAALDVPPAALDEEENIWEVEMLLAKRKQGRRTFYLVKWKGFPDSSNTWEEAEDISAVLIDKFESDYALHGGNFLGLKLVGRRMCRGRVQYLAQWQGRPEADKTWIAESAISDQLMQSFQSL